MQEALKFSDEHDVRDAASNARDDAHDSDTQAQSRDQDQETPEQVSLLDKDDASDDAEKIETEVMDASNEPEIMEMADMSASQSPIVPLNSPKISYSPAMTEPPTTYELIKTPMLAIAAAVSLVVAGWSYSSLEQTRADLNAMTEAKASVDKALADAKSRLTNAEKAVAAVKAALTSVPVVAATGAAATAAEPQKEAAPK